MDVGLEFHSLSKSYNMTGWRLGMAVGNPEMIDALMVIKSNLDSGAPNAVQYMGTRRGGWSTTTPNFTADWRVGIIPARVRLPERSTGGLQALLRGD